VEYFRLIYCFGLSLAFGSLWGFLDNPTFVIEQLVEANYQKPSDVTMLQLYKVEPLFFEGLAKEVMDLIKEHNPSFIIDSTHPSYWSKPEGLITQYSLLNTSGIINDYSTDHNRSILNKRFAFGEKYPCLEKFISLFPHSINFRLNLLNGKACFTQHQEDICFYHNLTNRPSIRVRFHLPIVTNSQAEMLSEGNVYHFDPGMIYFFHNGCVHDGINKNEEEVRIHLLWDMLLTEDTYTKMFQRSIDSPLLFKLENVNLQPIGKIDVDPDYKRTVRKLSYQEAKKCTLCQIQ
jgi:hypothetical protein